MLYLFLIAAVGFLAYSNGGNDNFKGVASLYGSKTCSFRTAIMWSTITTIAGSIASIFLASSLLKNFSGKGLVPDALIAQPEFLVSVSLAAGVTVILATRLGFPVSTTHGLMGGLIGAALVTGPGSVNFSALGSTFIAPLLLSPVLAIVLGTGIYVGLSRSRASFGIQKESCICVGTVEEILPVANTGRVPAAAVMSRISVSTDKPSVCIERYTGNFLGINAGRLVDGLHFFTGGAVCFARALNDTPKIAALLLLVSALKIEWGMVLVAICMAIGGLLNSRRIAETMANKITEMNTGQALSANIATALLVNLATYRGLPVSTTHVSVGSLLGIGLASGRTKWKPVFGILLSWVCTLPCAALISSIVYLLLRGT